MQKTYLAASLIVASIVGLVAIPVIARHLDTHQMAAVSIVLLFNSLLGMADVLRPVFVRAFTAEGKRSPQIPIRAALSLSIRLGVVISILLFAVGALLLGRYFGHTEIAHLAIGAFVFCLSITFWAVLDSSQRVGTAQLIRVTGTSALYASYALLSVAGVSLSAFTLTFIAIQAALCLSYYAAARQQVTWQANAGKSWQSSDVFNTLQVNAAKILIDFGDRFVFARTLPAGLFAGYAITYELASRTNVVPQYINTYLYPKLCISAAEGRLSKDASRHLLMAIANFTTMTLLCLVTAPLADRLLGLYAGAAYAEFGYLLPFLLFVSGLYSLAFYAQSFFRASGDFHGLAKAFNIAAAFGVLLGTVGWIAWGYQALVVCVTFLKAPGVGAILHLADRYVSRRVAAAILVGVTLATSLVTWVTFSRTEFVAFVLVGVPLISGWTWLALRSET